MFTLTNLLIMFIKRNAASTELFHCESVMPSKGKTSELLGKSELWMINTTNVEDNIMQNIHSIVHALNCTTDLLKDDRPVENVTSARCCYLHHARMTHLLTSFERALYISPWHLPISWLLPFSLLLPGSAGPYTVIRFLTNLTCSSLPCVNGDLWGLKLCTTNVSCSKRNKWDGKREVFNFNSVLTVGEQVQLSLFLLTKIKYILTLSSCMASTRHHQ